MRFALLGLCLLALGGASASAENAWRQGAPLPLPRGEVAAATVGRELVVVGGFLAGGASSSRVDAYSPARDRWRRLPDLPEPRAAAGAAIVGRTLYVVGGVADGGLARSMLAFDRTRGRWRRLPGPKPREHLGVSALGGRVYALAGREAGTNFDVVQAYVPARHRWVSLPRLPEPRGGTDSAAVGPLLVSAGSESAAGTSAAVYALDVRTRSWRRLPDLPTARHGLGVLGYRGRVYVIAGGPTPGLSVSDANEYLQLR